MPDIHRRMMQPLLASATYYPITTVIGPRQSGKTTLVKATFPEKPYVSLEDPDIRSFATEDPRQFLAQYPQGGIFDEIQRVPELLSYIQSIVDETDEVGLYILTGSHQLALQEKISQTLAGRTGIFHLLPLSLDELHELPKQHNLEELIYTGFYPRLYKHTINPTKFYGDYVQTYVERDVKLLLNIKDLDQFQRFVYLCATRIGCPLDYTHFANELGCSRHTIKQWVSLLKASFVIHTIPPYLHNLGKRIIKTSKLYFVDVGLACYLLGIKSPEQIPHHPLYGMLFENLVINEALKLFTNQGQTANLYYFRDSNQLEIDLMFEENKYLKLIEIKSSQTFKKDFLKNLEKFITLKTTRHNKGYVIYSGQHQQKVHDIQILNYQHIHTLLESDHL